VSTLEDELLYGLTWSPSAMAARMMSRCSRTWWVPGEYEYDIPTVTRVTATTLFTWQPGKLMATNVQIHPDTRLTTSTLFIWYWPVRSRGCRGTAKSQGRSWPVPFSL